MDLSGIILAAGGAAIVLGLVFCFFGYKLGRLLFPLCGLLVIEGLIYIYVYTQMQFDALGTWMLFAGSGVAVYIILFFIKRIAGFFTGLLGSALFLLYIVNAFSLQNLSYLAPACITICIVSGLLTVAYQKSAVIVFTSLFGACVAAFAGIFIYIQGVVLPEGGIFTALQSFLSANAIFIAGASAGVAVAGILIQSAITASSCVLMGKTSDSGSESFTLRKRVALAETPQGDGSAEGAPGSGY